MSISIKVENLSKIYRLGEIGTGTLSRDLERWWKMKVLRQEDPFLKIGEINDRTSKAGSDFVWSLKDINFEIIAVSTDDSRTQKRVKPLVNGKEWNYKILLDTNQDFKRALAIVNIPYTIVVKNNTIVHVQNGYVPGNELELFEKLKSLKYMN